jgi:hypothetical protein
MSLHSGNDAFVLDGVTCDEQQHTDERAHQRAHVEHRPLLARDEVLDIVFSFVGCGDYFYVAGVSQDWRSKYTEFCLAAAGATDNTHKLYTSHRSALMTAAGLQLALDNKLTVNALESASYPWELPKHIAFASLEPIKVMTLAVVSGVLLTEELTDAAAEAHKFELLEWLHKCGCPWHVRDILQVAAASFSVDELSQLLTITGPCDLQDVTLMLLIAGEADNIAVVKWSRERSAAWPQRFCDIHSDPHASSCWSLQCAQWAIANGSTWLNWRCQDLAPQHYRCESDGTEHSDDTCSIPNCNRKKAAEVFTWAHEHGCPCTCNSAVVLAAEQ